MDLHIVGGFLGSGKTTAIINAAKVLMGEGKRVGVVTNDQGKYLVDTAFFHSAAIPAVEVTGGCFCCNYDDLDVRLAQLGEAAQPEVIFAESVGSCADIVATVVKPLLALRAPDTATPRSFSVFVDARLLHRRLLNLPMPFSDEVIYLFDKQIEEAGMLIINKRDLLSLADAHKVLALAETAFTGISLRLQNSLETREVVGWVNALTSGGAKPPLEPLDIDYRRYGSGEAALAWLDETLIFRVPDGAGRGIVCRFAEALLAGIERRDLAIGHVKLLISAGDVSAKVSWATLAADWRDLVPDLPGDRVSVLLNARVETDATELHRLVEEALALAAREADVEADRVAYFHPSFPNPTHRMA